MSEIYETLLTCMQQKLIFITQFSNLTKQMEVRSRQEDIDLGDLLQRRQNLLERIGKCDELISKTLQDSGSPQLRGIVSGLSLPEGSGDKDRRLFELACEYYRLLEESVAGNQKVQELIQKSYNEAKEALKTLSADRKHTKMFR
ncbi:MAG TPA: hypothetical protein GXX17_01605 [Clostridiales bacterium]|nr:hypothetical protein [Clostridiales bacterium]